ncbi:hypothetical protein THI4931_43180 [Pandoraea sputorum]|nr:hypothetical protein THI4931_43180 [Pandoraea sputorum]
MVAPEATNRPVPMDPPTAIIVRWRADRERRNSDGADGADAPGSSPARDGSCSDEAKVVFLKCE